MINKYLEFMKIEAKEDLADRSRFFVWIISKPIIMIMQIMIWTAVFTYSNTSSIGGFSIEQTINYFLFMQIFGNIIYNNLSEDTGEDIYSGYLSMSLLKPVNFSLSKVFGNFGGRIFSFFYESIPTLIVGLVFFNFTIYSLPMMIVSIISLFLGLLINSFFSLCWSLIYFRMINFSPFERIKRYALTFISGYYIPIAFMPLAFQKVLKYLPFNYVFYEPSMIYFNIYSNYQILQVLLMQVLWIMILYLLFNILFKKMLKKFEGVGA